MSIRLICSAHECHSLVLKMSTMKREFGLFDAEHEEFELKRFKNFSNGLLSLIELQLLLLQKARLTKTRNCFR